MYLYGLMQRKNVVVETNNALTYNEPNVFITSTLPSSVSLQIRSIEVFLSTRSMEQIKGTISECAQMPFSALASSYA